MTREDETIDRLVDQIQSYGAAKLDVGLAARLDVDTQREATERSDAAFAAVLATIRELREPVTA